MVKKNENHSSFDLAKMLQQPQTRALLARLQQLDSETLQQAAQSATQGDTEAARRLLTPLLQDEQVRDLTQQLRDANGGI